MGLMAMRHDGRGFGFQLATLAAIMIGLFAASALGAETRKDRPPGEAETAIGRPDHVEVKVVGRASEVSADGQAFTVEANAVSFRVEPGFGTRFPSLRSGDRVVVSGTLRSQTRLAATEVRVLTAGALRTLSGTLRGIDRRRSRITLRTESGETADVPYDDETVFARLGRRVTADELRPGDQLWVEGPATGSALLRATRVEVTGSPDAWQLGRSGEVVDVNRRDRRLRVDFAGETRTVIIDDRTEFQRGSRTVSFEAIGLGDSVRVSGQLRGNAVEARRIEVSETGGTERTVEGHVRGIDLESRTIRVRLNALIPITVPVYVPPDTPILRGTQRLNLEEIHQGDRIRARGSSRNSRLAADTIEILP
jgi:hypothetical protein